LSEGKQGNSLLLKHLLTHGSESLEQEKLLLQKEAEELMLIFAAILRKLDKSS